MISNENTVRKFVSQNIYIVNIVLILCHLAFSVIYRNFGMTILFYENLFSIVLCVLAFIFLKKKLIKHYVYLAFIELYIFMIFSLFFLGWELGYQHYCISFTISVFFCDFYLNKREKLTKVSVSMAILNMFLYVGFRLWTYHHEPIYFFENKIVEHGIFVVNSVLTFFFISLYMFVYSITMDKLKNELRYMAENDSLTGLYNRRKMMAILEDVINPQCKKNIVVAMIDVDFFKKVNDTYGHDAGDAVLIKTAEILKNYNFENTKCSVCRWGGEEFLIVNEYDCSEDAVIAKFEGLRKTVENCNVIYGDKIIKITITIGVSFYQKDLSLDIILKKADLLLYKGKESGRNQVSYEESKSMLN